MHCPSLAPTHHAASLPLQGVRTVWQGDGGEVWRYGAVQQDEGQVVGAGGLVLWQLHVVGVGAEGRHPPLLKLVLQARSTGWGRPAVTRAADAGCAACVHAGVQGSRLASRWEGHVFSVARPCPTLRASSVSGL